MGQFIEITNRQLAWRNVQDKDQVWIANQGNVYDGTMSRIWLKGKHDEHCAGQGLTNKLKEAPHTKKVFEKFKIIGILK